VLELHKGDVKEAFRNLKGRYRTASEMQTRPCHQTMECQTEEQLELYAERGAYGETFPANGTPFAIGNNQPSDGKLRTVVSLLSHGWCGGASGIWAEHIKAWLCGAKKAEDPETATYHVGAGKTLYKFVSLCSSLWAMDTIPQQMCWVVTVIIPMGGESIRALGC
jgi:hypothetical protein